MRKNAALLICCVLLMLSVSGLTRAGNDHDHASLAAAAALIIPTLYIYTISSMLTEVSRNTGHFVQNAAVLNGAIHISFGRHSRPPVFRDDGSGGPNGKFPPGSIQRSCALRSAEIRKRKLYLRTILDFFLEERKGVLLWQRIG